jgi:hypothetical protein
LCGIPTPSWRERPSPLFDVADPCLCLEGGGELPGMPRLPGTAAAGWGVPVSGLPSGSGMNFIHQMPISTPSRYSNATLVGLGFLERSIAASPHTISYFDKSEGGRPPRD